MLRCLVWNFGRLVVFTNCSSSVRAGLLVYVCVCVCMCVQYVCVWVGVWVCGCVGVGGCVIRDEVNKILSRQRAIHTRQAQQLGAQTVEV